MGAGETSGISTNVNNGPNSPVIMFHNHNKSARESLRSLTCTDDYALDVIALKTFVGSNCWKTLPLLTRKTENTLSLGWKNHKDRKKNGR